MEVHHENPASATIVDVLNEDCWRAILDLIHVKDIIQSERVSRQWQNVILQYLQGAYFSIEYPWLFYRHKTRRNVRELIMDKDDLHKLDQITTKWGPYIMKADCINKASLEVIARNCPNLENVTFLNIKNGILLNEAHNNFKNIKQVYFCKCEYITDECISKWLDKLSIEELAIMNAKKLTGQFLVHIQSTNLRSLAFKECQALKLQHLLSVAEHLTRLNKLELVNLPKEIFDNMPLLFAKLPKLQDLTLRWQKMVLGHELAESVGRLGLKRLDLNFDKNVNDEWLEIVARGCGRLQELVLEGCSGVTVRGICAVCRAAGPALRSLNVGSNNNICDRHVEAFIIACPNLTSLDLSYCMEITENLVAIAAQAARGRPRLRLDVEYTMVEGFHEDRYPWLILDFGE